MNSSCAKCWMDFEDELALAQHVENEHPSVYVLPPYRKTQGVILHEVITLVTKKKSA